MDRLRPVSAGWIHHLANELLQLMVFIHPKFRFRAKEPVESSVHSRLEEMICANVRCGFSGSHDDTVIRFVKKSMML